jgi:hypothetical protein
MSNSETKTNELSALSPADQERVREYIAFLAWRAAQSTGAAPHPNPAEQPWHFSFLEHFAGADVAASRDAAGMEVKIAEATVGGQRRPALWQHPPLAGESTIEFHVAIPAGLRDLRLRFAIGIRDGAQAGDQLIAFRARVDGWQVWSRAAWPTAWQSFEIALPFRAGNVLRLTFATDALGSHPFAWAAWGEPELVGVQG